MIDSRPQSSLTRFNRSMFSAWLRARKLLVIGARRNKPRRGRSQKSACRHLSIQSACRAKDTATAWSCRKVAWRLALLSPSCGTSFQSRPATSRMTWPYAIAGWFSLSGSASTTFVRSRTCNASSILIVRSKVIPKYSFRSSRETCDSWTSSRLASSRCDTP